MKKALTQISGMVALPGGIAGLIGFLFLPFARNPLDFRMNNGSQLLPFFLHQLERVSATDPTSRSLLSISYGSMWAIMLTNALLVVLALVLAFLRKPGIGLPLTGSFLSIVALGSQFMALYLWWAGTPGVNLWSLMFTNNGLFTPIIGIGWWVSMGGSLLALAGSILSLSNGRGGRAALTSSTSGT